ncbi:MAG: S41 family peptidase [Fuerstiella sp.]
MQSLSFARFLSKIVALYLLAACSLPLVADERPAEGANANADAEAKADSKPPLSDYELMKLFVETYQQVDRNYVRDVDRRELVEAAIQGMLQRLDQYSSYIPPAGVSRFNQMVEQEFGGIGITVNLRGGQLLVVSPLPGTPAYRGGIRAGDVITEVDGEPTEGVTLNEAVQKLQGPIGRPVTVTVVQPGSEEEPRTIRLVRQLIKAPTVRGDRYLPDGSWSFQLEDHPDIGYVRLSHFSRYTSEELKAAVDVLLQKEIRGLILDLRRNPGGLLESAVEIADMFLDKGQIVSVKGRNVPEKSWEATAGNTFPQLPLAILVSRYSASASEVLSACLQDNNRAVVIGERTWGKGSVQNVIQMEDGDSALKLTTATYHRPSGVNIHRFPDMRDSDEWGVTPNEGFRIRFSNKDWRAWDRYRSGRDVLKHEASTVPDAADEEAKASGEEPQDEAVFVDRHILAAVDYINQQRPESKAATTATADSPNATSSAAETTSTPDATESRDDATE